MNSLSVGKASLVIIAGLWLGRKLGTGGPLWLIAGILLLILWLVLRRKTAGYITDQPLCRAARISLGAAILCFSFFRIGLGNLPKGPQHIDHYIGTERVTFYGTVTQPPRHSSNRLTLRVSADSLQYDLNAPNEGSVEVIILQDAAQWAEKIGYGTRLQLSGKLSIPPDSAAAFSYRDYLERDGVGCVMYSPLLSIRSGNGGNRVLQGIYSLRSRLVDRVMELFPEPENALLAGILLGDETHISTSIENDFKNTGTSHIIAISGSNYSLICMVLLTIVRRLVPVWWAPLIMLPFIAFYSILVGGSAAVIRAAVMCGLTMIGKCMDRKDSTLSLIKAAALMLLWDPEYFEDVGFQLSAVSTLGILLFAEGLEKYTGKLLERIPDLSEAQRKRLTEILSDLVLISLSAQALTIWVSASAFGQISLISPAANFLIAPFQSMIMLGGFLSLLLSYLFLPFGKAAAYVIWPAPALTIRLVRLCARSPLTLFHADLGSTTAWCIIGLIVLVRLNWRELFKNFGKKLPVYLLIGASGLAAALWSIVAERRNDRLQIRVDDSRSRFTLSFTTPHQRRFLIAGGLNSYSAGDLMSRNIFTQDPLEGAVLDFSQPWMKAYFKASGKADGLSLLLMDDHSSLGPGASLEIDGLTLTDITERFGRRCWLAEFGDTQVLFPLGIAPANIPEVALTDRVLVVLTRQDDPSVWDDPRFPNVFESSGYETVLLESDGAGIFLSEIRSD